MKKILPIILLLPVLAYSQYQVPQKVRNTYVSDYTGTLTQGQLNNLNARIRGLKATTGAELGIAIVPTLQGYDQEEAALAIMRTWGIGQAGKNNGILYLLCPNERKSRIEVGPGLEGDVTDGQTGRLQRDQRQYYKNGDYYTGISNIVDGLIDMVPKPQQAQNYRKPPTAVQSPTAQRPSGSGFDGTMFLLILGCVIIAGFVVFLFWQKAEKKKQEEQKRKEEEEAILAEERRKEQAIADEQRRIEKERLAKEKAISDLKAELNTFPRSIGMLTKSLDHSLSLLQRSVISDQLLTRRTQRDLVVDNANKVFSDSGNWVPDSMSTSSAIGMLSILLQAKEKLNNLSGTILSNISDAEYQEQYVKDSIPRLTRLRQQALIELPNTPLQIAGDDIFKRITNCFSGYRQYFHNCKDLEAQYDHIIGYRAKKKRDEEEAERKRLQAIRDEEDRQRRLRIQEEARRRRHEQEEEDDRRRRESYYSSTTIFTSSSSSNNDSWGSSSPSDDNSSFSGGSSSGGGSDDSW